MSHMSRAMLHRARINRPAALSVRHKLGQARRHGPLDSVVNVFVDIG